MFKSTNTFGFLKVKIKYKQIYKKNIYMMNDYSLIVNSAILSLYKLKLHCMNLISHSIAFKFCFNLIPITQLLVCISIQ